MYLSRGFTLYLRSVSTEWKLILQAILSICLSAAHMPLTRSSFGSQSESLAAHMTWSLCLETRLLPHGHLGSDFYGNHISIRRSVTE